MEFIKIRRGAAKLCYDGFPYTKKTESKSRMHCECYQRRRQRCKGTVTADNPAVMMPQLFAIFLILAGSSPGSAETLKNLQTLNDDLFTNYNKHFRGVLDQRNAVSVTSNFSLLAIRNVREVEEAFEVIGILHLEWKDERLVWNPLSYNGTDQLVLNHDKIWKPKVRLGNPMLDEHTFYTEDTNIRIHYTGVVTSWSGPYLFKSTCRMNIVSFPWDRQFCDVVFAVSQYSKQEVNIAINQPDVDLSSFKSHESWNLVNTAAVTSSTLTAQVQYMFCVERKPSFHISVLLFPVGVLSVLSLFTFIVKVDSGERISYAVTLLLAITIDVTSMSGWYLPTHSNGTASIIFYVNGVLGESALICIISILNLHVYHREGSPPQVCRKIFMALFCKRFNRMNIDHEDSDDDNEARNDVKSPRMKLECHELQVTWVDISGLIDRVGFVVASVTLIIFYLVFGFSVLANRIACKDI